MSSSVSSYEARKQEQETPDEALDRIQCGTSKNDMIVILAFESAGILADDIIPRVNVLTFHAWRAKGRRIANLDGFRPRVLRRGARIGNRLQLIAGDRDDAQNHNQQQQLHLPCSHSPRGYRQGNGRELNTQPPNPLGLNRGDWRRAVPTSQGTARLYQFPHFTQED